MLIVTTPAKVYSLLFGTPISLSVLCPRAGACPCLFPSLDFSAMVCTTSAARYSGLELRVPISPRPHPEQLDWLSISRLRTCSADEARGSRGSCGGDVTVDRSTGMCCQALSSPTSRTAQVVSRIVVDTEARGRCTFVFSLSLSLSTCSPASSSVHWRLETFFYFVSYVLSSDERLLMVHAGVTVQTVTLPKLSSRTVQTSPCCPPAA